VGRSRESDARGSRYAVPHRVHHKTNHFDCRNGPVATRQAQSRCTHSGLLPRISPETMDPYHSTVAVAFEWDSEFSRRPGAVPEVFSDIHYASITDSLAIFADDPLIATPGTKCEPSNYGYDVVGCVLECATQTRCSELLQELA